ncbi:pPIWI_RE module domain-containing protein [Streptomyces sp. NPDC055775]
MYTSIRRAAYVLDAGAAPWTADYRALPYPEHWRKGLLGLCNFGRDEDKYLRTVPTRRLDGVLQTLAPDLVVRPRPRPPLGEGPPPEEDFWLYVPSDVPDPLPGRTLGQVLDAWLRTLGPKDTQADSGFRDLLLRTSSALKSDLPSWEAAEEVSLLTAPVGEGGTAAPAARQFQLATDALARRIVALDPYEFEGGTLRLRAVPRGPKQQGAELMSQPLCRTVKRKEWWFSVVLNITLHTLPFDPRPRLHLHWGVRRWATHPRARTGQLDLTYRQATSIYLRPDIPWLPGAPASERYAVARLVRDHRAETFGWVHNDPAGILHQLSLGDRFPAPEELLSNPVAWIGEHPGVQAAVTHSTRMGSHEIGTGFMPHQCSQLTEWAEQALPRDMVRVPDLVRVGRNAGAPANRRPKPSGDEAKKAEAERAAEARRQALALAARFISEDMNGPEVPEPPVVEARLLWQTAELRRSAVSAFADVLGLDGDGRRTPDANLSDRAFDEARAGSPVVLEWRTAEAILRLRCLPLNGGLGERLLLDPAVRGKGRRIADAVSARRQKVRGQLKEDGADPALPSLALVEIAHPSTFRAAGTDPKFALRLGCADAGVLTQFAVTPSAERGIQNDGNLDHRTANAWLDGLRQLGVRVLPEHTLGGDLPDGLQYAALWMVKRRKDGPTRLPKHLPVAVLMTPLSGVNGAALVQGWDNELREWVPYPTFLLGLVNKAEISPDAYTEPESLIPHQRTGEKVVDIPWVTSKQWRSNLADQRKETARFVQRMLHSLRSTPTVLITHAQNSRLHWPWIQDSRAVRDLLKPGHAPAGRLDDDLRVVRVRGRSGRETAQWWGVGKPGESNGQPAGFWAHAVEGGGPRALDDRVFYSATSRPQTQPVSPSLDRLAARVNAAGKLASQAGTNASNPTLVEITVLGCHPYGDSSGRRDRPEAIALAMHQLRQAPDYADALSLPLPLHLAGQAQEYVLPTLAEEDDDTGTAPAAAGAQDPDGVEPPSAESADLQAQLLLF